MKRKHQPGCPCCPEPCKTRIAVQMWGCSLTGLGWRGVRIGGTVSVSKLDGTLVGEVSCDPDAIPEVECVVEVPGAGDYVVTVQPDGYGPSRANVLAVTKCETRTVIFQGAVASALGTNPCFSNNCVSGATITVATPDGPVSWATSCPNGSCAPVLFPAGTYSYTVESPTERLSDTEGSFSVNTAFPQFIPLIVGLGVPAPGYVAIPGCKYPIKQVIHATTALGGAITANYSGGSAGTGLVTFDATGSYDYPGSCDCEPKAGVGLFYRISFTPPGGNFCAAPDVHAVLYYSKHLNPTLDPPPPPPPPPPSHPVYCPESGAAPTPALGVTSYGAALTGTACPESGAVLLSGVFSGGGLPNDCLGSDSITLSE